MTEQIGYVLKKVQTILRARMDETIEAHGLTVPQYAALRALEKNPGISNAELARKSFVTPQTMIRIVANLEASGLVTRTPHPAHGRILQTVLTPTGMKRVAACHEGASAVEKRMLSSLTPGEREQLRNLLERCAQSLE